MSEPPDFRLEQSELRSEDEFDEFGYEDLEYYVDFRGTLCPDDDSLAASGADVAIVGAPLYDGTSGRPGARFGPRAIRSAPTTWGSDAWSIQLQVEPYARLKIVDAGDAPVVASRHARGLRVIHEKVLRVASSGALRSRSCSGATIRSRTRRPPPSRATCGLGRSAWSTSTRTRTRRVRSAGR